MATYLLTWNPKRWAWEDYDEASATVQATGSLTDRWSTGGTKRIVQGDRLFLMRVGSEPRGIVGSGTATSAVYEAEHWDDQTDPTAGITKTANYVELEWDVLLPAGEALPLTLLKHGPYPQFNWAPMASGVEIPAAIANALESYWIEFARGILAAADLDTPMAEEIRHPDSYPEGARTTVVVNRFERSRAARQACIDHYGTACSVCDVDLTTVYGALATGFIHVHHMVPLAQVGAAYALDPVQDLRPVCPNCHAMLHLGEPQTLSIEKLRQILHDTEDTIGPTTA